MLPHRAAAVLLMHACVVSVSEVQRAGDSRVPEGEWAEWTSWSSCTVDCGVGLTVRSRRCQHPSLLPFAQLLSREDDTVECVGVAKEIKLCNKQACSTGPGSLREKECAKYRASVKSAQNYTWEPFIHPSDPCKLSCRARGHHFYANLADRVADGTPCRGPSSNPSAICVQGQCKEVGCDDVLESPLRHDACGVCQGDNSTCRSISGIFARLQVGRGATKVISIPTGATNINITELRPSNNTLALQTEDGNYFVNPEGLVSSAGNYEGAGTIFSYEKNTVYCPGQCIVSPGPTDAPVRLMMLSNGRNQGVLYSFNVPLTVTDSYFRQIIAGASDDLEQPSDPTAPPPHKPGADDGVKKSFGKATPEAADDVSRHAHARGASDSNMAADVRHQGALRRSNHSVVAEVEADAAARSSRDGGQDGGGGEDPGDDFYDSDEEEVVPDWVLSDPELKAATVGTRGGEVQNEALEKMKVKGGEPDTRVDGNQPVLGSERGVIAAADVSTPHGDRQDGKGQEGRSEVAEGLDTGMTAAEKVDTSQAHLLVTPAARDSDSNRDDSDSDRNASDSDDDDDDGNVERGGDSADDSDVGVPQVEATPGSGSNVSVPLTSTPSPATERNEGADGVRVQEDTDVSGRGSKVTAVNEPPATDTSRQSNETLQHREAQARKSSSHRDGRQQRGEDALQKEPAQASSRDPHHHQPSAQSDGPLHESRDEHRRRFFRRPQYSQSFTFRRWSQSQHLIGDPGRGRAQVDFPPPASRQSQGAASIQEQPQWRHQSTQQPASGQLRANQTRAIQLAERPKFERDRDPRDPAGDRQQWQGRAQALGGVQTQDEQRKGSSGENGHAQGGQGVTSQPAGYDRRQEEYRRELLRRRQLYDQQLAAQEAEYQRRLHEHNRRLREHQQRLQERAQHNSQQQQRQHHHYQQHRRRHPDTQHGAGSQAGEIPVDRTGVGEEATAARRPTAAPPLQIPSSGIASRVGAGWPPESRRTDGASGQRLATPDESKASQEPSEAGSDVVDNDSDDLEAHRRQYPTVQTPAADQRTGRQPFVPTQAPSPRTPQFISRNAPPVPQFVDNEWRPDGGQPRAGLTTDYHSDNKVHTVLSANNNGLVRVDDNLVPSLAESRPVTGGEDGARTDSSFLGAGGYEWRVSGLTDCTLTCGGGVQQTAVVCLHTRTRAVVTDENCSQVQRPRSQAVTCNTRPCPAEWHVTEWSQCSATCGPGEQSRALTCMARVSATLNLTMPDGNCDLIPRPEGRRVCQNSPCNNWRTGNWSECSSQCGEGVRTREVRCVDASGREVADTLCPGDRPAAEDRCEMGPCGEGWYFTEWPKQCPARCGSGAMTRAVHCLGLEAGRLPDSSCDKHARPANSKPCRTEAPCGGEWFTGEWEQCNATCGAGVRTRDVVCMKSHPGGFVSVVNEENCLPTDKPITWQSCDNLPPCISEWYTTSWSECSVSCGTGQKTREIKCLNVQQNPSSDCDQSEKPRRLEVCSVKSCDSPAIEPASAASPDCQDTLPRCELVRHARLCRYPYYQKKCCATCSSQDVQ